MSERYAPIGIKGAVCVAVLLITVWEMTATTEATTGEAFTPFPARCYWPVSTPVTTTIANSDIAS